MLNGLKPKDSLLQRADVYLKIMLFIAFVLLLILIRIYKTGDCDLCNIRINETSVNQEQFMNYYFDECLSAYRITLEPINYFNNLTINYTG